MLRKLWWRNDCIKCPLVWKDSKTVASNALPVSVTSMRWLIWYIWSLLLPLLRVYRVSNTFAFSSNTNSESNIKVCHLNDDCFIFAVLAGFGLLGVAGWTVDWLTSSSDQKPHNTQVWKVAEMPVGGKSPKQLRWEGVTNRMLNGLKGCMYPIARRMNEWTDESSVIASITRFQTVS